MYRIVTTTVASADEADRLARGAVHAGLAACAQQRPVRSTYRWQGVVEQSDEIAIDFKTTALRADELVAFVEQRHSYTCPEVIVVPIESGAEGYLEWIRQVTESGEESGSGEAGKQNV